MPSTSTITTFYEFAPQTVIKSSYVNANFQNFRGHILPINTDSASSSNYTHDLGSPDHYWRSSYVQEHYQNQIAFGSTPPANSFNSYFKSDGKKYKKNSSDVERTFLDTDLVLAKGDLLVGLGANTLTALTIGSNGYVLTADSATTTGMVWKANAGNPLTTKGDLFCFDTAAARLPVGTDGQFLVADSASSAGIKWSSPNVVIYTDDAGGNYPASTTYNALTFNTQEKDSTGSFNGATGVFTAPASGVYSVSINNSSYASVGSAATYFDIVAVCSGSGVGFVSRIYPGTSASGLVTHSIIKNILMLKDDTLTFTKGATYSSGTVTRYNSNTWNSISITKVGNY